MERSVTGNYNQYWLSYPHPISTTNGNEKHIVKPLYIDARAYTQPHLITMRTASEKKNKETKLLCLKPQLACMIHPNQIFVVPSMFSFVQVYCSIYRAFRIRLSEREMFPDMKNITGWCTVQGKQRCTYSRRHNVSVMSQIRPVIKGVSHKMDIFGCVCALCLIKNQPQTYQDLIWSFIQHWGIIFIHFGRSRYVVFFFSFLQNYHDKINWLTHSLSFLSVYTHW